RVDDTTYHRTYFLHDKQGHVWMAVKDKWMQGEEGPENYSRTWGCEFRYDSGRARYLVRSRDPSTLLPSSANDGIWSDYAGDSIYADHRIGSTGDVDEA